MLIISKKETWVTSDGEEHPTRAAAEHHVANCELLARLSEILSIPENDVQDILNTLSGMRPMLRDWLDGIDKMEKEI